MIELMSEVQCNRIDGKDYNSISEKDRDVYRETSESILEILSLIPGKIRGRIVVSYEMLERIFGIKEGKLLSLEDRPESCTVSMVHCDEDASLPIKEGSTIPTTEVFNKQDRVYACKRCKDREMAEAATREFKLGDKVQVFVDGFGLKDGVIVESGEYAYRVEIDNWSGLFGPMAIAEEEKEHDESEVPELRE